MTKWITDSGYVKFFVLSNSLADTAIIWKIQERDSILRTIKEYPFNGNPERDTTFVLFGGIFFDVIEKKSGMHEIIASSNFPVWQFPSYYTTVNSFGHSSVLNIGPPVYRYSNDVSQRALVNRYPSTFYMYDSLKYYKNIGMLGGEYLVSKGPITPYYSYRQISLLDPLVSVEDYPTPVVEDFYLAQNYPNPFNPTTSFELRVRSYEFVSLKIFDVMGREVAALMNERKSPGIYKVTWDASHLPSGVYFYRMTAGSFTETKKLVLMK